MAKKIKEIFNTDIGVGITGIAGPEGGTEEKPVGLVYFTIFTENNYYNFKKNFIGERTRIVNKLINSVFIELLKIL